MCCSVSCGAVRSGDIGVELVIAGGRPRGKTIGQCRDGGDALGGDCSTAGVGASSKTRKFGEGGSGTQGMCGGVGQSVARRLPQAACDDAPGHGIGGEIFDDVSDQLDVLYGLRADGEWTTCAQIVVRHLQNRVR